MKMVMPSNAVEAPAGNIEASMNNKLPLKLLISMSKEVSNVLIKVIDLIKLS